MLLAKKTRPRSSVFDLFAGSFDSLLHRPPNQIPFLDALRSLAILLVINGHASEEFTHKYGVNLWSRMPLTVEGWSGVDLFFVLSGFLIGGQIWKELRRTSDISIRQFILRRGFRIWPLYYCTYLFVLIAWFQHAAAKQYGWASVVFLSNYTNHGIVLGGWSLSTEEQFYCIVPICVYLFARRKNPRTVRFFLWGPLALEPLIRTATWIYQTGGFFVHNADVFSQSIYYCFHTHCDGLIMGLILSHLWVYREDTHVPDALRQRRKGLLRVAAAFAVMILLYLFQHEIFSFTGLALFFGSLVWFGLTSPTRSFNSKIFYWISRLSYGMYLNHAYLVTFCVAVVLPYIRIFRPNSVANQILGTLILIVLSALISVVTFCLIEHPFLNLRKKMLGSHPPA